MSEFAPPSGPPPPRVPEGWKACWNQQYSEWFFVNLYTKESTWEKPTAPAHRGDDDAPPGAPPPGYAAGPNAPNISDSKKTPLESNNPYNRGAGHETDEEMARRLQREENERTRGASHSPNPAAVADRGHADSYYSSGPQSPGHLQGGYPGGPAPGSSPGGYQSGDTTKRGSGGGFFGKLKDKLSGPQGSSQYPPRPSGYQGQPYNQQPQYGGYQQQQPGYGQYGPQGGYMQQPYQQGYQQGYGQPQYMQAQKKKGGLGAGGAAALGVGGGLLGGMLLADAIEDHDQNEYDQGFADGDDYGGGDMGGDF